MLKGTANPSQQGTGETQELLNASEQMKTENGVLKCQSHPTLKSH